MRAPSPKERAALAMVQRADEEERHRAFCWGIMSRQDKARALLVAGMNKHRATDALETFTAEERAVIHGYLVAHISKMEVIAQLMGITLTQAPARKALH